MAEIQFQSQADTAELARAGGEIIIGAIRTKPDLVLCVATGASPQGLYEYLARKAQQEPYLFRKLRVLKLDEWLGLPPNDPGTCEHYIRRRILQPLGVTDDRYFGFNAYAADPAIECARLHDLVMEIGIDITILGVGANGHVGLNEPAEALPPFAHVAQLAPGTQQHSMLTHAQPSGGMTLGMGEIMSCDAILLLAPGDAKQPIVRRLMEPTVTTHFPVSLLWLHPNTICLTCPG